MVNEDLIVINGINAASGTYDFPPMTVDQMSKLAQGQVLDENEIKELQNKHDQKTKTHWAVKEGVDERDLAQTGWGVIFAFADKDKTPAVKDALKPLLDWRRSQAAKLKENRYKEYIGPAAYRPNETKNAFLQRHGMGPGPADPDKIPYYLLIVGDPEVIPYRVQYQLDVQYAVGRIHFDNVEDYAKYARNVVLAEQQGAFLPRQMTLFGVANPDDAATNLSAENLIQPLGNELAQAKNNWGFKTYKPVESTKAQLDSLLNGGQDRSAVMFAASHGMGFPLDHELQTRHQGALLCQDWPGPQQHRGSIPDKFYFSGDDLSSSANLLGLLAFFFACYGAGTPQLDEFAHKDGKRAQIAPKAFLANLPRRMLQQGALAVVGHVERAWGTSFMWGKAGKQIEVFKSSFQRLMDGYPVGHAFEYFNERYAELSSDLSTKLEEIQFGAEIEPTELVGDWTANNDARSYVIIGDPASRLAISLTGEPKAAARPGLATQLAAIPVMAPAAADPLATAQTNLDALTGDAQKAVKQAIENAANLQRETDVKTSLADVNYDANKGVITGTAQVNTTTHLDPGGKSGSWDIQVEIKITAKKK